MFFCANWYCLDAFTRIYLFSEDLYEIIFSFSPLCDLGPPLPCLRSPPLLSHRSYNVSPCLFCRLIRYSCTPILDTLVSSFLNRNQEFLIVKLHLRVQTHLQLDGVGVDFVFTCHKKEEEEEEGEEGSPPSFYQKE